MQAAGPFNFFLGISALDKLNGLQMVFTREKKLIAPLLFFYLGVACAWCAAYWALLVVCAAARTHPIGNARAVKTVLTEQRALYRRWSKVLHANGAHGHILCGGTASSTTSSTASGE
jgi:hypothetical protein